MDNGERRTHNGLAVNIQLPWMTVREREPEKESKGESDRLQVSLSVNGARKRYGLMHSGTRVGRK